MSWIVGLTLAQGGGQGIALAVQFALIVGIMYFLFILPQRREQKRHRELLASLKPGDQIVTAGGLIGEIITIKDESITLKSGDARVVIERARVTRRVTPDPA